MGQQVDADIATSPGVSSLSCDFRGYAIVSGVCGRCLENIRAQCPSCFLKVSGPSAGDIPKFMESLSSASLLISFWVLEVINIPRAGVVAGEQTTVRSGERPLRGHAALQHIWRQDAHDLVSCLAWLSGRALGVRAAAGASPAERGWERSRRLGRAASAGGDGDRRAEELARAGEGPGPGSSPRGGGLRTARGGDASQTPAGLEEVAALRPLRQGPTRRGGRRLSPSSDSPGAESEQNPQRAIRGAWKELPRAGDSEAKAGRPAELRARLATAEAPAGRRGSGSAGAAPSPALGALKVPAGGGESGTRARVLQTCLGPLLPQRLPPRQPHSGRFSRPPHESISIAD
ncbi:hypothetical protein AAY473_011202 [Plecturocebus cupreus]